MYHFYPRSPCGERPAWNRFTQRRDFISIHALLAESDREPTAFRTPHHKFLSTLSLRRATFLSYLPMAAICHFYPRSPCGERRRVDFFFGLMYYISIHALLAESDHKGVQYNHGEGYFYPRSPCGERPFIKIMSVSSGLFLSTLSLRRATKSSIEEVSKYVVISIHALLAESDYKRTS